MCVTNTIMKLLGVLLLVTMVSAVTDDDIFMKDAVQFLDGCGSKSLSICFKERALTYIDQLPTDIEVGGMFTVKQTERNKAGRRLSSLVLPDEPKAREEMLDNILAEGIYDYFASHTFEFKIPTDPIRAWKRSLETEARKEKEDRKGLPLLLFLQLKTAVVGAMFLKLIGLIAFKALLVAKIALTLASVIGLRKLLESSRTSTYEVVAHPHHTEEYVHDRSFGQQMAYKAQEHVRSLSGNV